MIQSKSVYEELSDFIAGMNPQKVIAFKASASNQERLDFLSEKQKEEELSEEEKSEVAHHLIINRIVGLAKVRAMQMVNQ
jgi:CRISPR/Cas system CSM-associated protein Csm3 (group 7 of RAMP superfamily)